MSDEATNSSLAERIAEVLCDGPLTLAEIKDCLAADGGDEPVADSIRKALDPGATGARPRIRDRRSRSGQALA